MNRQLSDPQEDVSAKQQRPPAEVEEQINTVPSPVELVRGFSDEQRKLQNAKEKEMLRLAALEVERLFPSMSEKVSAMECSSFSQVKEKLKPAETENGKRYSKLQTWANQQIEKMWENQRKYEELIKINYSSIETAGQNAQTGDQLAYANSQLELLQNYKLQNQTAMKRPLSDPQEDVTAKKQRPPAQMDEQINFAPSPVEMIPKAPNFIEPELDIWDQKAVAKYLTDSIAQFTLQSEKRLENERWYTEQKMIHDVKIKAIRENNKTRAQLAYANSQLESLQQKLKIEVANASQLDKRLQLSCVDQKLSTATVELANNTMKTLERMNSELKVELENAKNGRMEAENRATDVSQKLTLVTSELESLKHLLAQKTIELKIANASKLELEKKCRSVQESTSPVIDNREDANSEPKELESQAAQHAAANNTELEHQAFSLLSKSTTNYDTSQNCEQ